MPDLKNLSRDNYRTIRKKVQLFAKACQKRGPERTAEGALMLFQSLEGMAWSACEEMDLDLLDTARAFEHILDRLDVPFQYDVDDEKPQRIEELVNQFYRTKNETLRDNLLRFGNQVKLTSCWATFCFTAARCRSTRYRTSGATRARSCRSSRCRRP